MYIICLYLCACVHVLIHLHPQAYTAYIGLDHCKAVALGLRYC